MDAECEDVFSDELGLSECFTAHSSTAGAQGLAENACRGRCTPAQSRHIQHGRLLQWQVIRACRIQSSVPRAILQHGSGRSGCGRPENVVLQRGKRRDFQPVAQIKTHHSETTTVGSLLRCVHTIQIKLRGRQGRQDLLWCASIRIGLAWLRPESRERRVQFALW